MTFNIHPRADTIQTHKLFPEMFTVAHQSPRLPSVTFVTLTKRPTLTVAGLIPSVLPEKEPCLHFRRRETKKGHKNRLYYISRYTYIYIPGKRSMNRKNNNRQNIRNSAQVRYK